MIINNRHILSLNYILKITHRPIEMYSLDHIEELYHRIAWCLICMIFSVIICICTMKKIIKILQEPAFGIYFLQNDPGEYFFVSLKIVIYLSLFIAVPFFIYQSIIFLMPGVTKNQKISIIYMFYGWISLLLIGTLFGYYVLIPITLTFFISYGSDVIEPFWSFKKYIECILIILRNSYIVFQLPIVQILLSLVHNISAEKLKATWRFFVVISTIVSAIVTPSVDPLNQISLSCIIIVLYFLGIFISIIIEKFTSVSISK